MVGQFYFSLATVLPVICQNGNDLTTRDTFSQRKGVAVLEDDFTALLKEASVMGQKLFSRFIQDRN